MELKAGALVHQASDAFENACDSLKGRNCMTECAELKDLL